MELLSTGKHRYLYRYRKSVRSPGRLDRSSYAPVVPATSYRIDWIALRAFLSFHRPTYWVDTPWLMSTRRPILLSRAKPLLGKTHDRNTTPPSFSFFVLKDIPMPSYKISQRLTLVERVLSTGVLAMVACVRGARSVTVHSVRG